MVEQNQREQAERMANRLMDLHEDTLFVHKRFIVRNNKQVNRIIRLSMMGMAVMLLAMLALVATFTSRMDSITVYMVEMAKDMESMQESFRGVAADMDSLQLAVGEIDLYVGSMPPIAESVDVVGMQMSDTRDYLDTMAGSMENIQQRMGSISAILTQMDRKFLDLTGAVGGIGRDVDVMSKPMSILPRP